MTMYEPGGHPKLAVILLQLHAKRAEEKMREAFHDRNPHDTATEARLQKVAEEIEQLEVDAKAEIFRLTEVPFDLIQEGNL